MATPSESRQDGAAASTACARRVTEVGNMDQDREQDRDRDREQDHGDRELPTETGEWRARVVSAAAASDADGVRRLIAEAGGRPCLDYADETGMSPLQYAAYAGNTDMVKLMLRQDCDPNFSSHVHKWTALHFAGLSGNATICNELLEYGADSKAVNSISRTAAQMAAFVGNHKIGATISNFIPRSEIEFFAEPREHQSEPDLPPSLCEEMHSFVLDVNLNPIRVALNLQKRPGLSEELPKVKKVLWAMCAKEMSKGEGADETRAFKYHYLSYAVGEIMKLKDRQEKRDTVEVFSKKLLKPGRDGFSLDFQDLFIKEAVREFPYRECTLFRQMVITLGCKDPPPPLHVINTFINGQRGVQNSQPSCDTCGEEKPAKKCSKCKSVQYCDRECQRLHWFTHKKSCNRLSGNLASASSASSQRPTVDTEELSEHLQDLVKMS